MPGRIGFEVNPGAARDAGQAVLRRSDTRRLLVLGDFSGRQNRESEAATDLRSRPIMEVDVDNFDAAFRRVSPRLALGLGSEYAEELALEFESLDDFHPDNLYRALEPFGKLRESRSRLLDPATFEQEARRMLETPSAADVDASSHATEQAGNEDLTGLLNRLIGAPVSSATPHAPPPDFVEGLIRRLVQPHIRQASTSSPEPFVAALDASATDLMRSLLSDPDFQNLEALWRGVRGLVDSLDLGGDLKLYLVDVTKAELLTDLAASNGVVQESAIYGLLVGTSRSGADAQPWSLLAGYYRFAACRDDLALLAHLAVVASHAGGSLLAEAEPSMVGCDALNERTEPRNWAFKDPDVEKRWNELRRSPAAAWLGLAMPRILLRLPYGAKTDPIESFSFEEFDGTASHDAYLWGNPALACAQVIGRTWLEGDENVAMDAPHEIDGLPAHVRDRDGERQLQPCAEFLLPVRVGEGLLQRGMIPLLSYSNRNAVRVARIQSISTVHAALAGFDRG